MQDIVPHLGLTPTDVFVDLGSGTGKTVVLAALHAGCSSVGVELVPHRHALALDGLSECKHKLRTLRAAGPGVSALQACQLVEGDFCKVDLAALGATVAFTNNRIFQPDLMMKLLEALKRVPSLRTVRCSKFQAGCPWFALAVESGYCCVFVAACHVGPALCAAWDCLWAEALALL